jgi:hypothetical protein
MPPAAAVLDKSWSYRPVAAIRRHRRQLSTFLAIRSQTPRVQLAASSTAAGWDSSPRPWRRPALGVLDGGPSGRVGQGMGAVVHRTGLEQRSKVGEVAGVGLPLGVV